MALTSLNTFLNIKKKVKNNLNKINKINYIFFTLYNDHLTNICGNQLKKVLKKL